MRTFALILWAASLASGESHPSWWNFASPEATALVGIQWENIRQSAFADVVGAELSSSGGLSFPDLPCIKDAKQILISSPDLLAVAYGNFAPEVVRHQATAKGLKPGRYRGIDFWISPAKSTLSVAQISSQLLLIGARATIENAVDRDQAEVARRYSPLLARAARFAQQDLWVVSNQLPDPLANVFVPLEIDAKSFEGSVSIRDGLHLDASLDAGSQQAAEQVAEGLRQSIPDLPNVARGLQVSVAADRVNLKLTVDRDQFTANLRRAEALVPPPAIREPQKAAELAKPVEPAKPPEPQMIRIFGLDDGPREIVLPPPDPRF